MAEQQVGTGGARLVDIGRNQPAPSLVDGLRLRAQSNPERKAFTFLGDDGGESVLTYTQLDRRARAIAAHLQQIASPQDRVLLVYPPGLDFISAFFGCIYAGMLAVPATYPKPRRPMPRLEAIAGDCDASVALTTSQCLTTLDFGRTSPVLESIRWVTTDGIADENARQWQPVACSKDDLAFLQYTSGSTSDPKGVMVSHENLTQNLAMISEGFGFPDFDFEHDTSVFWLPAYHDMGLIGGILSPIYMGTGSSILMSPTAFLQRPLRWLQTISERGGTVSGAPNFAYQLCVDKITPKQRQSLDLSSWKLAFCGAEPIRTATLERFVEAFAPCGFREDAFYPCYGLAEATLIVSGGAGAGRPIVKRVNRAALAEHRVVAANGEDEGQIQKLIGCGSGLLEQEVVIVQPETRQKCEPRHVGEIWIKGPNVARGYWNRLDDEQTFDACLAGSGDRGYLRTGDLGFLSDGQLFVTGRLKDVIIIRGSNHYPQDIERTIEEAHPSLNHGTGATFSVEVGGQERLVVIHEVDRQYRNEDLSEVVRLIRGAVATGHELEVYAVALIRHASMPRTTSGKVQRSLCRQQFLAGELKTHLQWCLDGNGKSNGSNGHHSNGHGGNGHAASQAAPSASSRNGSVKQPAPIQRAEKRLTVAEVDQLAERIESFMIEWLVERAALPAENVHRDRPFAEFGLDSLTAVELSQELEDWLQVRLTPVAAWNYPTPMSLARYLAEQVGGHQNDDDELSEQAASDEEMEKLLAEIESLSDEEAEAALRKLSE